MQIVIDINDNEYLSIKNYPDDITSYPVTIHLYKAVRNGRPLDEVVEDIKQEIPKLGLGIIGQSLVLECIDKHTKGESE